MIDISGALEQLYAARKTFTDRIANMNEQYANYDSLVYSLKNEIREIDDQILRLIRASEPRGNKIELDQFTDDNIPTFQ